MERLHGTGIFLGVAVNLWGELWRRIIGYSCFQSVQDSQIQARGMTCGNVERSTI